MALVYSSITATYYNVAFRDINQETTLQYAFIIPASKKTRLQQPAAEAGFFTSMPGLVKAYCRVVS